MNKPMLYKGRWPIVIIHVDEKGVWFWLRGAIYYLDKKRKHLLHEWALGEIT